MFTLLRLDRSIGLPSAIERGLSQVPRRRATVDATLELTHQRVDDVPLLLGFLSNLRLAFRTFVSVATDERAARIVLVSWVCHSTPDTSAVRRPAPWLSLSPPSLPW